MKKFILILSLLTYSIGHSHTSREIFNKCTSDNYFSKGYCLGYLEGNFFKSAIYLKKSLKKNTVNDWVKKYDIDNMTLGEITDTYTQFLKKHPDYMGKSPFVTMATALLDKYPDK